MPHSPWVAVDSSTVPSKHNRELRDAWEDFVAGRELGEDAAAADVRQPIVDSWRRSRDAGVDPTGRQSPPSVVDPDGAADRWSGHPLADALGLISHCMTEAALEADHLLVISDADGTLLRIWGDVQLRNRAADEMNFVEGALWSEAGAGTNAVGTAVAAGHAVQVFAAEHFAEPVQRWTCAAAPVMDPETHELLGVIDLTGDFSGVNPHSLSLVVATASAVEERLRRRVQQHDDERRSRYRDLLGPESAGAALVTGSGRLLLDPGGHFRAVTFPVIPAGGGDVLLSAGVALTAEPVAGDDLYVVRQHHGRSLHAGPRLELRLLGDSTPEVRLDGDVLHLRPRHIDLLALMVLHRGRLGADSLCWELYGEEGHPASIRVEMSRLRRLLPGVLGPAGYHLNGHIDSDMKRVRGLLGRGDVSAAAAAYPGPLLPHSGAPGIVRARQELDAWMRQAVITSADPEALWKWVRLPSGEADLLAWLRLLAALDYQDARRGLVVARVAALRSAEV